MKILIVKTSSLGDIIHTFPVVEYLKKRFPDCRIDWVVENSFAELVRAHPLVSNVICSETKNWRKFTHLSAFKNFLCILRETKYDLLFDFQANMKSGVINLFARSEIKAGFGKRGVSEWPNLLTTDFKWNPSPTVNVREENLGLVRAFFQDREPFETQGVRLTLAPHDAEKVDHILKGVEEKIILICPGSAWPNKQMSLTSLVSFLKKIERKGGFLFLIAWGNEAERKVAVAIQDNFSKNTRVLEKLSLSALQNLMDRVNLVFAMDSLPLHLAGTTSAKTYGVFGPSSALKYSPVGEGKHFYQGSCPYGRSFSRRCPVLRTCKTGACIREIDIEDLFSHFEHLI